MAETAKAPPDYVDATIISVDEFRDGDAAEIEFNRADGYRDSEIVFREHWPAGYWPPGTGDTIRVHRVRVSLIGRPREVAS